MPDLPLSSLLAIDGSSMVGEAAELEFELRFIPLQPQGAKPLPQVMTSPEFADAVRETVQRQVRKKFGKQYVADSLNIDPDAQKVTTSVSTLYEENASLQKLAKRAAAATEAIREDIVEITTALADAKPFVSASWKQGGGVFDPSLLLSPDTPSPQLEARLAMLKKRRHAMTSARDVLWVFAAVFILLPPLFLRGDPEVLLAVLLYGLVAAGGALYLNSEASNLDSEAREIAGALDLRRDENESPESRAERLFRVHSFELKRYYDQTLGQGKTIYLVGLICLTLGFAVIGVSLWLVVRGAQDDSTEQVVVGILGAIAGILADYIAVVYLKMFSQTIHAVTGFHRRFVVTHHLHFGNLLVSMIDDQALRNQTLAAMARRLSSVSPEDESEPSENGQQNAEILRGAPVGG
jgi:hypothetical protein